MKSSDQLFHLIKSLTKSEKRKFKLYACKYNRAEGNNLYTILFDEIDKLDEYDHSVLRKKLKGVISPNILSPLKIQLNEMILDILHEVSSKCNPPSRIRKQIDHINILIDRGLYSQAKKLLIKTKELSIKYEYYEFQIQLTTLEYKIAAKQSDTGELSRFIDSASHEILNAKEKYSRQKDFEILSAKMHVCYLEGKNLNSSSTQDKLSDIMGHNVMKLNVESMPTRLQVEYHAIMGHYHFTFEHPEEMYFHRRKVLQLLHYVYFDKSTWLLHIRLLLKGLSTFKMFREYNMELEYINNKLATIFKDDPIFSVEFDAIMDSANLNKDVVQGNYSEIENYLPRLEEVYSNPKLRIDLDLRLVFYFYFIYAHVANGNYRKAKKWLSKIQNDDELRNIRFDGHFYTQIESICISYCLGDYDHIPYLYKSATRFMQKHKINDEMAKCFLSFANKNMLEPISQNKLSKYDELINEMELLSQTEEGKISLEYFDTLVWIKSIRFGKTMEEIVKSDNSNMPLKKLSA